MRFLREARFLELSTYLGAEARDVHREVVPWVDELLDGVLALLQDLSEVCEGSPEARRSAGRGELALSDEEAEMLLDLCFVARGDLRARQKKAQKLPESTELSALFDFCESTQTELIKILREVERHLRAGSGRSPATSDTDLRRGLLGARRLVAKFRLTVQRAQDRVKETSDHEEALRMVGTGLAVLWGGDFARYLRADELLEARRLHSRILVWFQGARKADEAERLLVDIEGYSRLIQEINRREEIREFDLGRTQEAAAALSDLPADQDLPGEVREILSQILGRDEDLDARVLARDPVGEVREILASLLERLTLRPSLNPLPFLPPFLEDELP